MSPPDSRMLAVEGVHTYRGPAHVLHGVSLAVNSGETVCLVGRNGAGKTTTIESIMGLLPVRAGKVVFKGQDVTRLPAHRRARLGIGYAPEDAGIFPDLTVAENFLISQLTAGGGRTGSPLSPEEIQDRVFAIFPDIRGLTQRRGLNLSGGQKKMVSIARAMNLSPSILLLDEPFEGLAPVVVDRFIDAVKAIKSLGIPLLIAASNLRTATRIADRLYAIDRGEILFEGNPHDALASEEVMKTLRG